MLDFLTPEAQQALRPIIDFVAENSGFFGFVAVVLALGVTAWIACTIVDKQTGAHLVTARTRRQRLPPTKVQVFISSEHARTPFFR